MSQVILEGEANGYAWRARGEAGIAGSGPLLVLIPGARGTGATFQPLAQHLALHFGVLTYDRRGYAGGSLGGPQDVSRRLETRADNVALFVQHAASCPAAVFDSNSGALVALNVLVRINNINPGVIDTPMLRAHGDDIVPPLAARAALGRVGTPEDIAMSRCGSAPRRRASSPASRCSSMAVSPSQVRAEPGRHL